MASGSVEWIPRPPPPPQGFRGFYDPPAAPADPEAQAQLPRGPRTLGGDQVVFACADIDAKARSQPMAHQRANTWLKTLHTSVTTDLEDLTHHYTFDWKGFLSKHPMSEQAVGPGVVGFGFLTMPQIADASNGEVRARNDFVVLRADGTACRLHPHKSKKPAYAAPVYGRLSDWLPSLPPSFHAGEKRMDQVAIRKISQMDQITMAMASLKLRDFIYESNLEVGTLKAVEDWAWWRWLAAFPDATLNDMLEEHSVVRLSPWKVCVGWSGTWSVGR